MDRQRVTLEGQTRFWLEEELHVNADLLKNWWCDLVQGDAALVEGFSTDTSAFLALKQSEGRRIPLEARQVAILERIMLGERAKVLAIEYNVSQSTVTALLQRALRQLGWNHRTSTLPIGLSTLSEAARGRVLPRLHAYRGSLADGSPCRVLVTPLAPLAILLPRAVHEVVRLHVAGKSYNEIATYRATSARTVANQVSAAFRILRVSGRNELRHYLAMGTVNS